MLAILVYMHHDINVLIIIHKDVLFLGEENYMKTWLPTVKIGKILLREICDADYLDYFEIGRNPITVQHLNWGPFVRPDEALWVIQEIFNQRPMTGIPKGYAIVFQNRMIGVIDYHTYYPQINAVEIGYILHQDFWGQGIMKQCLNAATQIGFEHLEVDKLIVGHTIRNEASRHVIIACGYKYEYQKIVHMKESDDGAFYYAMYRYEYARRNKL